MKRALGYVAAYVFVLALVWAAMNAAGTDWAIPYAISVSLAGVVAVRRSA